MPSFQSLPGRVDSWVPGKASYLLMGRRREGCSQAWGPLNLANQGGPLLFHPGYFFRLSGVPG